MDSPHPLPPSFDSKTKPTACTARILMKARLPVMCKLYLRDDTTSRGCPTWLPVGLCQAHSVLHTPSRRHGTVENTQAGLARRWREELTSSTPRIPVCKGIVCCCCHCCQVILALLTAEWCCCQLPVHQPESRPRHRPITCRQVVCAHLKRASSSTAYKRLATVPICARTLSNLSVFSCYMAGARNACLH